MKVSYPLILGMLRNLVLHYGILGLFIASFLSSTIFFPFTFEVLLPPFYYLGISKLFVVLSATTGSLLGMYVNYFLGYHGFFRPFGKKIKRETMHRAREWMHKYGGVGLFAIILLPTPIPPDPVGVVCGAIKMELRIFLLIVALGKLMRYSLVLGILDLIL